MKKLLFSVAILAVAASCSKNEVPDAAPAAESAISFATLNNLARSANDAADQYQVYAAQEGVTAAWYIADYSKSEDDESLTNTYYWPTAATTTLEFMAFAPAPYTQGSYPITDADIADGTTVVSPNYLPTGSSTITEHDGSSVTYTGSYATENIAEGYIAFTFLSVDGSAELTAAAPCKTYTNADKGKYVPLEFHQLLSKIQVKLALDEEFATLGQYYLTGETYLTTKYKRGIYYLAVDERYPSDKVADVAAFADGDDQVYNFYDITYPTSATAATYDLKNQDLETEAGSVPADYSTNIIPQTASDVSITIKNLTIVNASGETVYDQAALNIDLVYNIQSLEDVQATYLQTEGTADTDDAYALLSSDVTGDRFDEGVWYTITLTLDPEDIYGTDVIEFTTTYQSFTTDAIGFTY